MPSDARTPSPLPAAAAAAEECPRCLKPTSLCVCDGVQPIDNRVALVILQHPQEQDRTLGTARLAALHFTNAMLKIGLSWPSLSKLVGRDSDPKRWAILYLGSLKPAALAPGRDIVVVTGKGEALPDQDQALRGIEGIILLDGTWSQAKAIWWRNAWMLKCRRVLLARARPSRYGKLRKEPHRAGLSTIEAAAMLLARLERNPKIEAALNTSFAKMLERYRAVYGGGKRKIEATR
jgi:DTW domain-containing protein YfiP